MQNDESSDLVAAFFLDQRDRADGEEFAKVGEAFTDDILVHSRQSDFDKAVAGLENVRCHREVLFRSLYRLNSAKTKVPEFPDSRCAASLAADFNRVASGLEKLNKAMASPIWQEHERRMTTVYAANASFQLNVENDQEIPVNDISLKMPPELRGHSLMRLAMRVGLLAQLDQDRIFKEEGVPPWLRVLRFVVASDEHERYYRKILQALLNPVTAAQLRRYAETLKAYRLTPRKDLLESYARARCSLYPTLVTGDQNFDLVADLLDSFENSPHATDAGLLRQNLANFNVAHPFLYARLESSLRTEHQTARSRSGKI